VKLFLALALLATGTLRGGLDRVKAEPNPERRSRAALENADDALKTAKKAYSDGDLKQTSAALAELQESVELSETSLRGTGKNPSRNPKHFKHAEIKTRELLRRLEAFQREMNVGDRDLVDPVKAKLQQVHEDILLGVMGKKR